MIKPPRAKNTKTIINFIIPRCFFRNLLKTADLTPARERRKINTRGRTNIRLYKIRYTQALSLKEVLLRIKTIVGT
jgi:hypothetical protein